MEDYKMLSELCVGYLRLSVDDNDFGQHNNKIESNSITNQRELVSDYFQRNLSSEAYTYIELADDGYSGTNFNRPQLKQLLEWIKQRKVKCIIVKDISRFSRDYIEVGNFLERIFPLMEIRFISINDNYDSARTRHATGGIDLAFRNLMYSLYSKDLSIKVKSAREIRIRKGYFTGGMPPFGFQFKSVDKRTLIIDEEAARVVRHIFELALSLSGTGEIARMLNQEKLPTPAVYKNRKKQIYPIEENNQFWNAKKVRTILQNEVYLGTVVNRKYSAVEIGAKRFVRIPDDERAYSFFQHGPIVSEEIFKAAQRIFRNAGSQKYKKHKQNPNNVLGGFLYCAVCNQAMAFSASKSSGFYFCQRPSINADAECPKIKLYQDKITLVVINSINKLAELQSSRSDIIKSSINISQNADNLAAEIHKLKIKRQGLHEKYHSGILTKDIFKKEKEILANTIEGVEKKLIIVQEKMESQVFSSMQSKDVTQITELTKELLKTKINKIWVHDEERIEIIWK
jgi:DNA invertase Pin-like site-specific DNA recombinase